MNPKISYHLGLCRYTFNIHKFPEPEILLEDIAIDPNDVETIQVSYPDYNGPDDPDENHDCEAMAVDSNTLDILLFTKNWDFPESYVYRVPEGSPGEVRVASCRSLESGLIVTRAKFFCKIW